MFHKAKQLFSIHQIFIYKNKFPNKFGSINSPPYICVELALTLILNDKIMNTISGWYYLHENGKLIYKNYPDAIVDIRDSDFALSAWVLCLDDRSTAWDLLVEAMSLGVNKERIIELASKWNCDDADAENYAHAEVSVKYRDAFRTNRPATDCPEHGCGYHEDNSAEEHNPSLHKGY